MLTYTRGLHIDDFNCTDPAIEEFPPDGLTDEERRQGYVAIHFLIALYIFIMMAIVCDEYFVPSVERLCLFLDMSTDVAGATFMAGATSAPELFVNIIGTFITEGDLGIGTIVGSAVCNTLGVAAICGTFSGVTIALDWWPLTRDCGMYAFTVTLLILILYDSKVTYLEPACLVCFYVLYIIFMYNDKKLQKLAKESACCQKVPCFDMEREIVNANQEEEDDEGTATDLLLNFPRGKGCLAWFCYILKFPAHLVFFLTIPDCRIPKCKNCFPCTFTMSCVWIGALSYSVAWMLTVIGDTFYIPDSVMGITFLAVGTSIPEFVSSIIVARKGYGSMAICNSIGSNTFDILVCLGMPWFFKTMFFSKDGKGVLYINSSGLVYSTITLLTALCMLYLSFVFTYFTLGKRVGMACMAVYILFLIFATLIEMNVFFEVNLPRCDQI